MSRKERTLTGLLVKKDKDTKELIFKEVVFKDELENLYNIIEAHPIDIQERYIANKCFDFVIDDEYLLKGYDINDATGFEMSQQQEAILGAFLILGQADEEGRETSLTSEDIALIKTQIIGLTTPKGIIKAIKYTYFEKGEN